MREAGSVVLSDHKVVVTLLVEGYEWGLFNFAETRRVDALGFAGPGKTPLFQLAVTRDQYNYYQTYQHSTARLRAESQ